jgi:hypothetical protein
MQLLSRVPFRTFEIGISVGLPRLVAVAIALLAAIGIGVTISLLGPIGLMPAFLMLAMVLVVIIGSRLWWWMLMFALIGNFLFSRGFAGVGVFPIFVTEGTLAAGFGILAFRLFTKRVHFQFYPFKHFLIVVLVAFFIVNLLQTIPYIPIYGLNALRDGFTYFYLLFALVVMVMVPRERIHWFFTRLFPRLIPIALVWFPIFFILMRLEFVTPRLPFTDGPFLYSKLSDLSVHLAGIGGYMLLGLGHKKRALPAWQSYLFWALWLAAALLFSITGRAAMLCIAAAFGIILFLRPMASRWQRPVAIMLIGLVLLIVSGAYSSVEIDIGNARKVSAEQLVANITSIFGGGDNSMGGLDGTRQWRLLWWDSIINYTFNGPYFWTGKGYGINLATADGFQVDMTNESLRAPHNGHLTFLARGGVPSFMLWMVFIIGFCLWLLTIALKKENRNTEKALYATWLLAYMVAFQIIAAFDVFIEGPMGGSWMWALIGMAFVYFQDEPGTVSRTSARLQPVAEHPQ